MAFGSTFQNDLTKLLLNATAIANIADNAASSPATNLYLSLHTANPAAGNQTTSEATYTSYARLAIVRTSSGWTVSGNVATLAATATFAAATGSPSETLTYAAIGTASTGTGKILFTGALSSSISVTSAGVQPVITTATTFTLT